MNEEEWKLLWNQFELSDESVKEFCSRNGMKPRAFYYFKNKLQIADLTGHLCGAERPWCVFRRPFL